MTSTFSASCGSVPVTKIWKNFSYVFRDSEDEMQITHRLETKIRDKTGRNLTAKNWWLIETFLGSLHKQWWGHENSKWATNAFFSKALIKWVVACYKCAISILDFKKAYSPELWSSDRCHDPRTVVLLSPHFDHRYAHWRYDWKGHLKDTKLWKSRGKIYFLPMPQQNEFWFH